MADADWEGTVAKSVGDEERYRDPYGLYRRWFGISEDSWDETNGGEVNSAELGEMWRRWFETTVGGPSGGSEAERDLLSAINPLWTEMAEDISARMRSGETLPEDPIRFFLRWYNDTNEKWSKAADELLRKDEVLKSSSHLVETYARSHRQLYRTSEERLKSFNIPTRSDVARVAKLIVAVENKVDRLEEAFEEFIYGDAEPATAEAVDGLEERMHRLEDKMDRVLATLERLEATGTYQDLPRATREMAKNEDADADVEPLEGLSLNLIKAGQVGTSGRGALEGPQTKEEE